MSELNCLQNETGYKMLFFGGGKEIELCIRRKSGTEFNLAVSPYTKL